MPIAEITLFDLLQQGGWAMYPLGCLSMTLFALILFSWMQTSRGYFGLRPSRWTDQPVTDRLEKKVGELAHSGGQTVERQKTEDFLMSIEGNTLRWIKYMNVIATIAPMVGLLGTVSGMIGAFQTIATGGMGKPELLAGDIGEALITTATGLTIGIPAMIFYFMLRNRLDARLEEIEEWIERKRSGSAVESQPIP
jgi:biopolymer transport protein ExbB